VQALAPAAAADKPAAAEPAKAATSAAREQPRTQVRRNEQGHVVEIVGPDAATVLDAYCQVTGDEAVGIAAMRPPQPAARIGVFRAASHQGALRAVHIRMDRRTNRWALAEPIYPFVPPDSLETQPIAALRGPR
ncbi:MAG TPA: hypothetical protein VJS92_11020, partial [Candidatus Polarisedimenticolaceae bacterium]|nr:hypothetical protein [Candidatus Polarisedimenticolaceae bacterium]